MKLAFFNLRLDEKEALKNWQENHKDIILEVTSENLTTSNMNMLQGCRGVVLAQNQPLTNEIYDFAKEQGIKVFATRSAGFDIYDIELMKKYNIKMTNVPSYSPNAIAEYTVAVALYITRNFKKINNRVNKGNFTWKPEILSNEIRTLTVGILGTGHIGMQTAKLFKGLGANVLGYDIYPNVENENILTYVNSIDELAGKSNIISIHMPAVKEYKHIINDEFINKMPNGSILINVARGMLVDTKAIIRALDNGKLLGAGLDVYENEAKYVPHDYTDKEIDDELLKEIIKRDDIVYTPHTAFYTTSAITNLVEGALDSAIEVIKTGDTENIVNR